MDAVRLGRQVRALRIRRRWRQLDLASAAKVSRTMVGRLEAGGAAGVRLADLYRVSAALDARLDVRLWWHGEALDRLVDAMHAALVEDIVRRLRSSGWTVEPEVTFNIRGERGSFDVLAWHPATRLLLVVEVKSAFGDIQATLMTLDRKVRLAPIVARRFGWVASGASRLLVVSEGRTVRRHVEQHEALFDTAFPIRGRAAARWLREPHGMISALLFSSSAQERGVRRPKRIRMASRTRNSCSPTTAKQSTRSPGPG